ncbi:oligosaccharide flippase family protein [Serratia marcescens]|uniref:Oligosaccharide flippase family protein n=1 Tax=Serratia marcescens TaxID=615 RepID=A0A939NPH4_SERMA|nr:oligosaccharide flippase family protein [Serratia marcescens]
MLERVSLSLSGIFVSIYVARYLGPAQFGALNYLLATIAIVVPLVQLGADSIIFNRVARRRPSGIRLMLASIRLRRWLFGGDAADTDMELFQPIARQPTDDVVAACQRLFLDSGRVQDLLRCPPAVETQYADQQLALLLSIGLRLALVSAALPLVWFAVPSSSAAPYLTGASGYSVGKLRPRRGLRRAEPSAMAVICSRWACRWPSPACR